MMLRRGVTLIELMAAIFILAIAFMPIIGVMSGSASDTDVAKSHAFAQTSARNILDTLLDSVPFYAIEQADGDVGDLDGSNAEDSIARIVEVDGLDFDPQSFLRMLGNGEGGSEPVDNFGRGTLIDERGTRYNVKLFVVPIPVSTTGLDRANELIFTYLPRPLYENQFTADGRNAWYTYGSDPHVAPAAATPYENSPNVEQPDLQILNMFDIGCPPGPAGNNHCMMKKILLRISWQNRPGHERRIEVFTMKANLD